MTPNQARLQQVIIDWVAKPKMPYGKYAGMTYERIIKIDISYAKWAMKNIVDDKIVLGFRRGFATYVKPI